MNFIKQWLQNIFQSKTGKLIKSPNKHQVVGFSHIAWTEKVSKILLESYFVFNF